MITYTELFAFCMVIIAIVDLIIKINDRKK